MSGGFWNSMYGQRKDGKSMYAVKMTEQVKRKKKAGTGLLKGLMVVFGALFILMGIMFSRGFMLAGFLLVCLYFAFDLFSQKEYEYTMEGTQFSIDIIVGRKHRRQAHELDLNKLEVLAPHWHEKVAKYRKNGGTERLLKYDYTSYDDKVPYYTMIIGEGRDKIKLLLDLNDEMLRALKTLFPDRVFFA